MHNYELNDPIAVVTWIRSLLFASSGEFMPPSLPGTSSSTSREALPVTPGSRKRPASFSARDSRESRPSLAASKASRRGTHPAKPTLKSEPQDEEEDDSSQIMDETSEMMDNLQTYSEGAEDEEQPCTSSSILSPGRGRAKMDRVREMTAESDETEQSVIGSSPKGALAKNPKTPKKKSFYTINDVHANRPAERFRTDILNQIRDGNSEYTPSGEGASLRLTDRWREEWSHGVQVLLHPKNLPHFETRPCDIPAHTSGPFRLPYGKYLLSKPAVYQRDESHVLYAPPHLRIYQGDRLDELWLERINREHTTHRMPLLDFATMLNLMNEFEIECFQNIHRIVLTSLASPSGTLNSQDGVDEDAPCDVCQIKEDNEDPMIFCDGCNVCLHLTCYGLTEVPEGHWECDMCKAVGFTRHDRLKCALCPNTGGAMKEVENADKWVHVSCAMWIPEIKFTFTKAGREVIAGLETIHDQRWQLKCSICDLRMGACIQCEYRACATAFHTTCAQRSGVCEVLHEKNEADESVNFHAFCKRHTIMRKREKEGAAGKKGEVDQSEDETDERSEVLRGLERAFFLHVKFEKAAKKLGVSQLLASDVYEYWKQKRSENGGRPLISGAQGEIEVDTETPILTLESAEGEGEGQIMLRASDDVQHQLTPFQLKCWRFQKHVFQTADRGRLGCDMIMKRERKKKDILDTNRELWRHLVELDNQPGIPLSTRVLTQIIEQMQLDMSPEEIAESDRMAEEMAGSRPAVKKERAIVGGKRRHSMSEARPSQSSPSKENGVVVGSGRGVRRESEGGERREGAAGASPGKQKRSINRRTTSFASPAVSPSPRASPHKMATPATVPRSRLRPQNPPDDSPPTVTPALPPTVPLDSSPSPSKLRERRDVKYF